MDGEGSGTTFWSRRSRKGKAALVIGGVVVALAAIGYALPEKQPESASAEVTTSVVTTVVTTTVEDAPEPTATGETENEVAAPKASPPPSPKPKGGAARVARVVDGDTLELANGRTVRLVQIDTPEASGECFGQESGRVLAGLLPVGARVRLERDPALDGVDRYGRILRYVHRGETNVNLALVRRGAASVWFFDGDRGRYADRLLAAARNARERKLGAWGACRATLDPSSGFQTRPKGSGGNGAVDLSGSGECMDGYSPCLPVTGDLDCADVQALGKAPVRVTGSDPYRLDGDDDGSGCD
ncbi:MAG: thermonuclease family protein [Gaiellaceae bacterium]